MKPHLRFFILSLLVPWTLFSSSCVSIKLSPDIKKSKGLIFNPPSPPFKQVNVALADDAWKSEQTGNTISYFSECSPDSYPLEKMRADVMSSLSNAEVVKSETVQHDGREALSSLIEGKLEGIPMRVSLFTYQKNGCRYSLSLTGRKEHFEQDTAAFDSFKNGFRAP